MQDKNKIIRRAVLGYDTSAYTTSVAAVKEDGTVLAEERRLLNVKKGDRGLRQSQAFFQHMANLPDLTAVVCGKVRDEGYVVQALAASSAPRPEEGSYMPVFMAGLRTAESIASVLDVPVYRFSHQEGHIAAAVGVLPRHQRSLAFHLSGGTSELLLIEGCCPVRIVGGSRDLSFGQLIDRTGVACGMSFPAGREMDEAALRGTAELNCYFSRRGNRVFEQPVLSPIHREGTYLNLSGMENSVMNALEKGCSIEKTAAELFLRIADSVAAVTVEAARQEEITEVILAGGVSSSRFLRQQLLPLMESKGLKVMFGAPELSSDNAVGVARLGMDALYKKEEPDMVNHGHDC